MTDRRHKDATWDIGEHPSLDQATLGVLMDIRDELKRSNGLAAQLVGLANCYRIPRALDACIELGADARRSKRNAAKRRKATK